MAKFGTIGFIRLKCIKSRSFVAFEAAFHDEIYNLVAGLIGIRLDLINGPYIVNDAIVYTENVTHAK